MIIYFLAEGLTEFKFIEHLLIPYLSVKNHHLSYKKGDCVGYIKNLKGRGTLSPISKLYDLTLNKLLECQKITENFMITSMIDLVGNSQHFCSRASSLVNQKLSAQYESILHDKRLLPSQKAMEVEGLLFIGIEQYLKNTYCNNHQLSQEDVIYLERNLNKVKYYIQPHEFEALFFSDLEVFFLNSVPNNPNIRADIYTLQQQISDYLKDTERCENINNSKYPALWLEEYLGYDKLFGIQYQQILYNYDLYQLINVIREHCPHFNNWVDYLCQIS